MLLTTIKLICYRDRLPVDYAKHKKVASWTNSLHLFTVRIKEAGTVSAKAGLCGVPLEPSIFDAPFDAALISRILSIYLIPRQ
jgi:hypothetical protein